MRNSRKSGGTSGPNVAATTLRILRHHHRTPLPSLFKLYIVCTEKTENSFSCLPVVHFPVYEIRSRRDVLLAISPWRRMGRKVPSLSGPVPALPTSKNQDSLTVRGRSNQSLGERDRLLLDLDAGAKVRQVRGCVSCVARGSNKWQSRRRDRDVFSSLTTGKQSHHDILKQPLCPGALSLFGTWTLILWSLARTLPPARSLFYDTQCHCSFPALSV